MCAILSSSLVSMHACTLLNYFFFEHNFVWKWLNYIIYQRFRVAQFFYHYGKSEYQNGEFIFLGVLAFIHASVWFYLPDPIYPYGGANGTTSDLNMCYLLFSTMCLYPCNRLIIAPRSSRPRWRCSGNHHHYFHMPIFFSFFLCFYPCSCWVKPPKSNRPRWSCQCQEFDKI